LEEERRPMVPRYLSNRKERLADASSVLRLAHSASIEDVLNDFAKIAAEKGICLCSVRFTRGRLGREFELTNTDAVSGRINELAVDVEGGQTRLVVKYFEPIDGSVVSELEFAAHLPRIASRYWPEEGTYAYCREGK
jgi:hypothetical protein